MLHVDPISKVGPVTAVAPIASLIQSLDAQANLLLKGQLYVGHVQSKVGEHLYSVQLQADGAQPMAGKAQTLLVNMQLSDGLAQSGQPLALRFIQSQPVPTFQLLASANNMLASQTSLSPTAQWLGDIISQMSGASTRYEAAAVVTHAPNHPQAIAHDLAQSISQSGLFYESHLEDLLNGKTNVSALMQEPQNQVNKASPELVAQQLSVLEHQRLSWQGEIWKGQQMRWDLQLPAHEDQHAQGHSASERPETQAIHSQMTLHLPHLGKVMANIHLQDGRLRVGVQAETPQTLQTLQQNAPILSHALRHSGQQLDALVVTQHEH